MRLRVDHLWEVAWANGITNPTVCVEVLAVALVVAQVEAGSSRAPARLADRRLAGAVATALSSGDPGAIERTVDALEHAARIEASSPVAQTLAADPARGALVLAAARAVVGGAAADAETEASPDRGAADLPGDLVGDVYEHVLNKLAGAGHYGQFRTPGHLVSFVVDLVDPQPGERVLDPACGTGSFLIEAARATRSMPAGHPTSSTRARGPSGVLRGDEIDPAMVRIAQRNLLLHGLEAAEVAQADGLLEATTATVVVANPPFGGSVRAATAARFSCGSAKTELLFLEQIMRRLAPGGRAGVIVPWGVVANRTRSAAALRTALLHDQHLDAVIELPAGAFGPYTDSRTAVVLWHTSGRGASGPTPAPPEVARSAPKTGHDVFMARVRDDGFTLDDRRQPTGRSELGQVAASFAAWSRGVVPVAQPEGPAMRSVPIDEIEAAGGLLAPARFVASRPAAADVTEHLERAVAAMAAPLHELDGVVRELERLV